VWPIRTAAGIAILGLTCAAAGQTFEVLHSFGRPLGYPVGRIYVSPTGTLVGVTSGGGRFGAGSVFKLDPDSGAYNFTELHAFSGVGDGSEPVEGLLLASDGNLYGTTYESQGNGGTLFRIDLTGRLTTIHTFDFPGTNAPLVQARDGYLYGTVTAAEFGPGSVFRSDLSGNVVTLFSFTQETGGPPTGGLLQASDGLLYGVTRGGGAHSHGTIYRLDTSGGFTLLHDFGSGTDGTLAYTGLVQGSDGALYGTTALGGLNNAGTIFRIDLAGNYSVLHSFSNTDGYAPFGTLLVGTDGYLYGTTNGGGPNADGTVFRADLSGNVTTLYDFHGDDGRYPAAGLAQASDGTIFGSTVTGGIADQGTVFALSNGSLKTLYELDERDGQHPTGNLIQASDGILYGTAGDEGVTFRIDTSGNYQRLHAFVTSDGADPAAGLIQAGDHLLYGTTSIGGATMNGTVFLTDASSSLITLHDFSGSDGQEPQASLTQATDTNLYGSTQLGGSAGIGTLFRLDTGGGGFAVLHSFSGPDGQDPIAPLLQASDGFLYGVSAAGGEDGRGTIFRLDSSGGFTTIHDFGILEGRWATGGLLQGSDGFFYGTSSAGGTSDQGSIFRSDSNGNLVTLYNFGTFPDGAEPTAGLTLGSDGFLYGTTTIGGTQRSGTLFRTDTSGNLTYLYNFSGSDGSIISAGVTEASDGNFYGVASEGGPAAYGLVYRWLPTTPAAQVAAVAPSSGPASGGTSIQVEGSHLPPVLVLTLGGAGASSVIPLEQGIVLGTSPSLGPGTLNDVVLTWLTGTATLPGGWFADFLDVPDNASFHDQIETIVRQGITGGCGGGNFCPLSGTSRAQAAVFLLKAEHGTGFTPPPCTGIFADVPCSPVPAFAVDWIEQLFHEGITAGCSNVNYCPQDPVNRAQMAVFLLKTEHGSTYMPPPCIGVFADVPCPSAFANWVEQLYNESVTSGCSSGPLVYCPLSPVSRGQMAVFLVKAFDLP
jgi:uncharacterized repeat protein (TIGR03803 family)